MNFFLTGIAFIVIFSILVLIHELGHFVVARRSGIKVEEFGFGLPPRIWGVKKGETLYSLNAIPFGGFVRLLGEDASDPATVKDPRSFSNKSIRTRIMVVLAGVFMNFILAIVLLTIGFIFGIQPLILNGEDVLSNIQDGTIQTQQGIIVKEISSDVPIANGLEKGDKILTVDGRSLSSAEELQTLLKNPDKKQLTVQIQRQNEQKTLTLSRIGDKKDFGFSTYELLFLPRLEIYSLLPASAFEKAGFKAKDILLQINDKNIYTVSDYQEALKNAKEDVQFVILRDNQIINFKIPSLKEFRTVITNVRAESPAEKSGFKSGDVITAIDGKPVFVPADMLETTKTSAEKSLKYSILRDNIVMEVTVTPDKNGLIGVVLADLYPYENNQLSFFNKDVATSVIKIQDVKYPFWIAPQKALSESVKLSGLTIEMFGNVLRSLVTRFTVPEGVSGPVGIAQLTYTFLQQGLLSLLRFMALLSLSLAVMNVLPFPALDGGRLLFIVIEIVLGRRLNPRYESVIHGIGFLLLMVLIVAVTYSDIVKLF